MAILLSWLNLGVCTLLMVACVGLYYDARGARQALAAISRRTSAHDNALAAQGGKMGALATGFAAQGERVGALATELETAGRRVGQIEQTIGKVERRVEQMEQGIGDVRRVVQLHEGEAAKLALRVGYFDRELAAMADLAFDAKQARERQLPPGAETAPPLDTEGDRAGMNPDAPSVDDHDTPEETRVYSAEPTAADAQIPGIEVLPYSAFMGRSSLVPPAVLPTLVSRIELPTHSPDVSARVTALIDERYEALRGHARAAGLAVDHCKDAHADCHDADDATSACLCSCDGCTRATSYVAQAEREILGPPQAHTPRSEQT